MHTLEVSKPISKTIFAVATAMWQTGQEITETSLTRTCKGMRMTVARENIQDMVKLSDLLNRLCPM